MRKSQSYECWSSRTNKNVGTNQEKLLVARNQRRCQEICLRMYQMLTEQSSISEESRGVTFTQDTIRTMARNQYRYCRTFIKIE